MIMIGKEKLFVAFHRDITERKRAEASLRESEQLFRRISDLTSDYIFTAKICDDGKLRLDFVMGAVEKITGYSIDEYKASDHWRILLNQDDAELDRHNSSRLINNNKVISEIRTVHKNGNTVWLRIYENPVRDEKTNKLVGVSCAVQDITERKLTEEELRKKNNFIQTVLDNLPMGVALNYIDAGDAFYINKKFEEIYGWPKEEMADISSFFKKVYPDEIYRNELLTRIFSDINSGDASRMHWENCVVTHKDGSKHVINAVNIPLFEQNTMVSTVFDITERVRTEEELSVYHNHLEDLVKARTDELNKVNECLRIEIEKEKEFELMLQNSLEKEKELNEIKTRLISTTSHEFRTPLTSVLSSTELLQRYSKKWSEDKLNVHFNRIKNSVEYLVGLLDEILTISRADRGRLTFNPEKVDLKTAANEYIEDARSLIKDHQLILNYQSGITQFLLDPKLLKFMISNLLSNAIKYSPDGGNIELKIKTDENQLIIEVSDEGMGIPASDIGLIFQSFFRSKNAEEIAGTGLGLSIVKLAADRHGADIAVKSEIGKGSTFTIRIPL
jgi:PAS domain S-box-containing protein